jgi:hypothetical protein
MSRATMLARAISLPKPPIFGIGRYEAGVDTIDFEIGWPEIERDSAWARSLLAEAGLKASDVVLVTAAAWESPWFAPIVRAIREIGIIYIPTEIFAFDVARFAAMLQYFPVKAVVGLGAETVNGLKQQDLVAADLLKDVQMVWARNDAVPLLDELGSRVATITMLGPALAMGMPGEPGALVNAREWRIGSRDGVLEVSSIGDRATTFEKVPTGLEGVVTAVDDDTLLVEFA